MNDDMDQRTRYLQRIRFEDQEKRRIQRRESRIQRVIHAFTVIYVAILVASAVGFAVFSSGV